MIGESLKVQLLRMEDIRFDYDLLIKYRFQVALSIRTHNENFPHLRATTTWIQDEEPIFQYWIRTSFDICRQEKVNHARHSTSVKVTVTESGGKLRKGTRRIKSWTMANTIVALNDKRSLLCNDWRVVHMWTVRGGWGDEFGPWRIAVWHNTDRANVGSNY